MSDKDLEPTNSKSVNEKDLEQVSGGTLDNKFEAMRFEISVLLAEPNEEDVQNAVRAINTACKHNGKSPDNMRRMIIRAIKDYVSRSLFEETSFKVTITAKIRNYNLLYVEVER